MSLDAARIAALAEREAASLLAYFERRVEAREDAADLLGETLLVIWRRAASVPHADDQALMWVFGVARRVLSGYRRSRRRHLALAERLRDQLAVRPAGDDAVAESVRAAVRTLPEGDRELIGLVHWEGFALHEAADILGVRAGAARMRYRRARTRLAAVLARSGDVGDEPLSEVTRSVGG